MFKTNRLKYNILIKFKGKKADKPLTLILTKNVIRYWNIFVSKNNNALKFKYRLCIYNECIKCES